MVPAGVAAPFFTGVEQLARKPLIASTPANANARFFKSGCTTAPSRIHRYSLIVKF
jgi:hypothetical protein